MIKLTREIILRILSNFGALPEDLNKMGLTISQFKSEKCVKIEYDDNTEQIHNIWAAETSLSKDNLLENKLRVMITDLTSTDCIPELALVFRMGKLPIHGLRLVFDNEDLGLYKLLFDNSRWINASIAAQAQALAGTETLTSLGFVWSLCVENDDLYQALSSLVLI